MTNDELIERAFAMVCHMSVDEVFAYNAMLYPHNPREGFEIWRSSRMDAYREAKPEAFDGDKLVDEKGFRDYCMGFALMVSATWGHA